MTLHAHGITDRVPQDRLEYFIKRIGALDLERQSFIAHYKDLSEFVSPRRGRFMVQDRNKGLKRHNAIINSAGTQALRTATAGMLNGTMSPSRPWFSLEPSNSELMESRDVREWLFQVERIIRAILNSSNFYNMAPVMLKELLLFGTGCMTHVDDFEDVARFYTHTAGSYWIAQNERLDVDTIVRQFDWTVLQIVEKFGLENVSHTVKTAYDRSNYDLWYPIVHFIEPNKNFQPSSPLSIDKKFISAYFEYGHDRVGTRNLLTMSGFDEFPAYVPRWDVTEGDIYGVDCPGMTALGDVKHLQVEEKRKGQAIDKMVNPPLSGPPSVKNTPVSGLPGGLTIYAGDKENQLKPIYQVDPRLQELRLDIDAVQRRVDTAFFVDLFLAISNMEGIQPRNQLDLSQRNEERLIQLGPVLERLHGDFLTKMIDRIFNQALKANILPPPPVELQGDALRIRFISTLAMAQRAVVTQDIESLAAFTGNLVQLGWETARDKFDADQAIDEYAKARGVPPSVVVSDEDVDVIREQQAKEIEQQQQMAMLQEAANVAKTASESETGEGSNLLGDTLGALDGEGDQ